jgi:hypothetical protein
MNSHREQSIDYGSFKMRIPATKGRRGKEEINLFEFGVSYLKSVRLWWIRGDRPPPRHYWSFAIALFLVGAGLQVLRSSLTFPSEYPARMMYVAGLCALGIVLAAPGIYCIFMSICCWRRLGGYDWWMIPHFG